MNESPKEIAPFLRLAEVVPLVGISQATIYREVKAKRFPAPIRLSPGRVAWRPADIQRWIAELPRTN